MARPRKVAHTPAQLTEAFEAATKKTLRRRPANSGRKPLGAEAMISTSVRMTPEQNDQLKALGGSIWLRMQIERGKVPDPRTASTDLQRRQIASSWLSGMLQPVVASAGTDQAACDALAIIATICDFMPADPYYKIGRDDGEYTLQFHDEEGEGGALVGRDPQVAREVVTVLNVARTLVDGAPVV